MIGGLTLDGIDNLIKGYLIYVLNQETQSVYDMRTMDDDEYDDFKFKAGNNYNEGYDIMTYAISRGYTIEDILTLETLTHLYFEYNSWASSEYGEECVMTWEMFTPANVLRYYVYYFLYGRYSQDELAFVLNEYIDESEPVDIDGDSDE